MNKKILFVAGGVVILVGVFFMLNSLLPHQKGVADYKNAEYITVSELFELMEIMQGMVLSSKS